MQIRFFLVSMYCYLAFVVALPPPLFAYIPLVIVLVTLPKDFISRAAWSCKFCLVNSRFDPIALSSAIILNWRILRFCE